MNNALRASVYKADGCYLTDAELGSLDDYLKTYPVRLKTYLLLGETSDDLIQRTLQKLAQTDRQTVKEHGGKCVRDMDYVLRAVAIAILKDDPDTFREYLTLWMQNIMTALHKEAQSARAYKMLQDVIQTTMPFESAQLVNGYLEEFIQALMAGT